MKEGKEGRPYLTLTEKSKATTKALFSRVLRHPTRKWSESILGYIHIYWLTYLLQTHWGRWKSIIMLCITEQQNIPRQLGWHQEVCSQSADLSTTTTNTSCDTIFRWNLSFKLKLFKLTALVSKEEDSLVTYWQQTNVIPSTTIPDADAATVKAEL